MKYVVYKDPWHGAEKYEVRTEPGERTMAHCSIDIEKLMADIKRAHP
jgi:hypothetical protein